MKKTLCSLFFAAFFAVSLTLFAYSADFPLCSDWALSVIERANTGGLLSETYLTADFKAYINRGEIAHLAALAYEKSTGSSALLGEPFDDAPDNSDISAVRGLGIMNGKGENLFKPDDYTTREEMAKIILSLKSAADGNPVPSPDGFVPEFSDFELASDWAKGYISTAAKLGIMNGRADGRFSPKDRVTREEAVALIVRAVNLPTYEIPAVSYVSQSEIADAGQPFTLRSDNTLEYELYDYMVSNGFGSLSHIGTSVSGEISLPGATLAGNAVHHFYIISADGVCSAYTEVYSSASNLVVHADFDFNSKSVTVSWNAIPTADVYTVSITENRPSVGTGRIPYGDTETFELTDETSLTFDAVGNYVYSIEILAGECLGFCEVESYSSNDKGLARVISDTYPASSAEAQALMTNITVPVWKLTGNGEKVASTAAITVHRLLADKFAAVFLEIFNGEEKFPINSVGGYSWRGRRSEHNGGTAIDINPNENFCIYNTGTVVGSYWKPGEDPYSISPYGDVVKAFEKYGFSWGGDVWGDKGTIDYMHFSSLGT